jgi:hypothetical protein
MHTGRSWNSDAEMEIGYGLSGREFGVRVQVWNRYSCPRRPDPFWGPPRLPSNRYRGSFPGLRGQDVKLTAHLQLAPRSIYVGIHIHSPIRLHGVAQGQRYLHICTYIHYRGQDPNTSGRSPIRNKKEQNHQTSKQKTRWQWKLNGALPACTYTAASVQSKCLTSAKQATRISPAYVKRLPSSQPNKHHHTQDTATRHTWIQNGSSYNRPP